MFTDALLNFIPPGAPLSLVGAAGVAIRSGVIDLFGVGVGQPVPAVIGNVTLAGQAGAMGVGRQRLELFVAITTGLVTGTAATLNVALQGAPDTGAGGGYNPGTWQTFEETGPMTAAQCPIGTIIMRLPWVPPFPANQRPRFLSLLFQVPAATDFTAGAAIATVTPDRYDPFNKYAANNYVVA